MLRALTLERNLIKEAMGFALDNAEAAREVNTRLICMLYKLHCVFMYVSRNVNEGARVTMMVTACINGHCIFEWTGDHWCFQP